LKENCLSLPSSEGESIALLNKNNPHFSTTEYIEKPFARRFIVVTTTGFEKNTKTSFYILYPYPPVKKLDL
jgi:hypothetical protein